MARPLQPTRVPTPSLTRLLLCLLRSPATAQRICSSRRSNIKHKHSAAFPSTTGRNFGDLELLFFTFAMSQEQNDQGTQREPKPEPGAIISLIVKVCSPCHAPL